ncbi:MAG: 2OG-Fe(II) oxygenase family protein [Parvularculaceae bacterium]
MMTGAGASLAIAAQDLIERGEVASALALLVRHDGPPDPEIFAARATAHLALGEPGEALQAAQTAMRLAPGHAAAAFNAGRALMMLGEPEEAIAAFAGAEQAFPDVAEIAARLGESAYLAGENEVARSAFERALALAPGHPLAFHLLAELLHQDEDRSPLERILADATRQGGAPAFRAISVLAQIGRHAEALSALDRLRTSNAPSAAIEMLAADLLREEGDLIAALARARAAASLAPDDADAHAPLARLLLMTGAAPEAESISRRILEADPCSQLWLAFLWTALAAQGAREADALLDFDRDVLAVDIDPPVGFSEIEAFNAALAAELEPLHAKAGAPLGQSVRAGSQTRRPLQTLASPAISAFFTAAKQAVDDFAGQLPMNPDHPFHQRRDAARDISGAWSVLLGPGGRHAAHVHPRGWISSAYYVALPPPGGDGPDAGSLTLGQPPYPIAGLEAPKRTITPAPGRLALFPSYCWHGTVPFNTPGRRLTIAFDVAAR